MLRSVAHLCLFIFLVIVGLTIAVPALSEISMYFLDLIVKLILI